MIRRLQGKTHNINWFQTPPSCFKLVQESGIQHVLDSLKLLLPDFGLVLQISRGYGQIWEMYRVTQPKPKKVEIWTASDRLWGLSSNLWEWVDGHGGSLLCTFKYILSKQSLAHIKISKSMETHNASRKPRFVDTVQAEPAECGLWSDYLGRIKI